MGGMYGVHIGMMEKQNGNYYLGLRVQGSGVCHFSVERRIWGVGSLAKRAESTF